MAGAMAGATAGATAGQVALRVFGQPGGIATLALHCSLAHSGAWRGLAGHLPGLHITAPDMPGHGRAAPCHPECNQHEVAARAAIALLREAGPPHLLIGHSFGAVVALRIAQVAPELVRCLVLFEPVLFCATKPSGVFDEQLRLSIPYEAALAAGDLVTAASGFHAVWGDGQDFADLPQATQTYFTERIHLLKAQNVTLIEDALGLTEPGRFEAIDQPVLILEGAESPEIIAAVNSVLARRLPRAGRATVAGAGHMLPITHAGECAGFVRKFLQEQGILQE